MFGSVIVVGENPEAQLDRFLPAAAPPGKAELDFYNKGGRWQGTLPRLKPDGSFEPVNEARAGEIAWEAACAQEERAARKDFAEWQRILDEHGRPSSREELGEPDAFGYFSPEVWAEYRDQPAIKAFAAAHPSNIYSPIALFGFDEDHYVRRRVLNVASCLSLVIDGKWHEVEPEVEIDDSDLSWKLWVREQLQSLPPDTLLTVFEYHF